MNVRGVRRVSFDRFVEVLKDHESPVLGETNAHQYYDTILKFNIDPAFILAIFSRESNMGRLGVAKITKSWGNTKYPSFGAMPIGAHETKHGTFPIYASWLDGLISTVSRLSAPNHVYMLRNLNTVEDIIPLWSPDNAISYVQGVRTFIQNVEDMMAFQVGAGVAAAMANNDDEPLANEEFEKPGERYSITPGRKFCYMAHKTYDPNDTNAHVGWEVYKFPKA